MEMYFSKRPLGSESIFQLSISLSTLENWKKQQPQNVIYEFISPAGGEKKPNNFRKLSFPIFSFSFSEWKFEPISVVNECLGCHSTSASEVKSAALKVPNTLQLTLSHDLTASNLRGTRRSCSKVQRCT